MWLVLLAVVGLLAPGGLFLYWLINDYTSLSAALSDRMAVAFFLDLLMSTFLLAYLFSQRPPGPVKWPWFVALSLVGTLALASPCFSGSIGAAPPRQGLALSLGGAPHDASGGPRLCAAKWDRAGRRARARTEAGRGRGGRADPRQLVGPR